MATPDLTPFGFTRTEAAVYGALLRLGNATGYAVARATRLARANVYAALDGLVSRGAAVRRDGRPAQYRATDPPSLLAHLAAEQAAALDRLERSLRGIAVEHTPAIREATGERAVANVILQLVARAERRVAGVLAADLWRATLPAWRRAAGRAILEVRTAGDAGTTEGMVAGRAPDDSPTVLVIDDTYAIAASGSGAEATALWSGHPAFLSVARGAIENAG